MDQPLAVSEFFDLVENESKKERAFFAKITTAPFQ
jgi:hypothetical protein